MKFHMSMTIAPIKSLCCESGAGLTTGAWENPSTVSTTNGLSNASANRIEALPTDRASRFHNKARCRISADAWLQCEFHRQQWQGKIMKSYRKELSFDLPGRVGFINLTADVNEALRASGIQEGIVLVNAMHITASVFINDDEPGLHHDYERWLEKLAPHAPVDQYRHNDTGEDNADAHMKRQVMGREVVVAVTNGRLDFGPWEQVFYGEFDGRRKKRVLVKIIGE
jgi:secondary thiamine-phosphate synthase enzyme